MKQNMALTASAFQYHVRPPIFKETYLASKGAAIICAVAL
jgi:hypothetical protein